MPSLFQVNIFSNVTLTSCLDSNNSLYLKMGNKVWLVALIMSMLRMFIPRSCNTYNQYGKYRFYPLFCISTIFYLPIFDCSSLNKCSSINYFQYVSKNFYIENCEKSSGRADTNLFATFT